MDKIELVDIVCKLSNIVDVVTFKLLSDNVEFVDNEFTLLNTLVL
jgi:hypothetical protein